MVNRTKYFNALESFHFIISLIHKMQTSTDLSQSIRTLTLDDFGITNKTS